MRMQIILALAVFASACGGVQASVPGQLTTTEEEGLYGVSVLRSAPSHEAPVVSVLVPGANIVVYPDTSPDHWWYAVLVDADGRESPGFVPKDFVKMSQGPFRDVPSGHWASDAIQRLKKDGVIQPNGVKNGNFRGEQALSHFQMAWILDRALTRAQESKAHIHKQIAELPVKIELTRGVAKKVDALIAQAQKIEAEEKELSEKLASLRKQTNLQTVQLDGLEEQLVGIVQRDQEQSRRAEELSQMTQNLVAEIAVLKKRQKERLEAASPQHTKQIQHSQAEIVDAQLWTESLERRVKEAEKLLEAEL